jgi:DNA-binding CsgD family transcriptional regulator
MELLSLFESNHMISEKGWLEYEDIPKSQIERWNQLFNNKVSHPATVVVPNRLSSKEFSTILLGNTILIELVESVLDQINASIWLSSLFILTDTQGNCLSLYCDENLLDRLEEENIGPATSFAMQNAGINAISMAMELKNTTFLHGNKHTLEIFFDWNSICKPIICGGQIIGYLDISFSMQDNYKPGILVLEQVVNRIEEKYVDISPDMKQQIIYQRFGLYGLAPREKEVCYLWLQNKSALCIAETLGITEGTVRNLIKNIYRKAEVNDKGQLFIKFIGIL